MALWVSQHLRSHERAFMPLPENFSSTTSKKIDIEKARKIDPCLFSVSEVEISEAINTLYELAELAFETYWNEKDGSKSPFGSLQLSNDNTTL